MGKKELYIVTNKHYLLENYMPHVDGYTDFIRELFEAKECIIKYKDVEEAFSYDGYKLEYSDLKNIADKNPNWLSASDFEDYNVYGSVALTYKQVEKLEDTFHIFSVEELYEKILEEKMED